MATLDQHSSTGKIGRLRKIRHVALDMDGTIYSGGTLFESTRPFLALLDKLRIGHTFLTNNSSKSAKDYLAHLADMGIHATADQLYISTQATIEYLHEHKPAVKRLFVLGTNSMSEEMRLAGFEVVEDSRASACSPREHKGSPSPRPSGFPSPPQVRFPTKDERFALRGPPGEGDAPRGGGPEPEAVVVGFDTALTFARLCRAAYWIKQGKSFIATHPDQVCPTDEPTVLVDCGSVCAALEKATGRAPDKVLGKPDPCMLRGILRRHSLAPGELAMVGDRLYTDMAMARRAGALGILVLTGETTADEAARVSPAPDLVVSSLDELGERLRQARAGKGAHRRR